MAASKKVAAFAVAALVTLPALTPSHAQMTGFSSAKSAGAPAGQELVHKTGRRHDGKVAAGIALGLLGAAALAASSSRAAAEERYESRYERRCRRWQYRCEDGDFRSCRKFDRRC
jgi:hypothetical protein